jgi:hypothetical protein
VKLMLVLSIGFLLVANVGRAEDAQNAARSADDSRILSDATTVYGGCVVAFAKKYASTHELAADIVAAAFGACCQERNFMSSTLSKMYSRGGLPQPEKVNDLVAEAEKDMERAAMRIIVETRNPAIK